MKKSEFFAAHDPEIVPILKKSVVGIAGCGGLGSNAAVALARAGIGKLIFADFDKVEPSNLNRQYFFKNQIGIPKSVALKQNIDQINPFTVCISHEKRINKKNISEIFRDVNIMIEAFDSAETKQMLIETWLQIFPTKPLIIASGLAGWGKNDLLKTRKVGNLYICGDEMSEIKKGISPLAPKVGIVANMQANLALEILLRDFKK